MSDYSIAHVEDVLLFPSLYNPESKARTYGINQELFRRDYPAVFKVGDTVYSRSSVVLLPFAFNPSVQKTTTGHRTGRDFPDWLVMHRTRVSAGFEEGPMRLPNLQEHLGLLQKLFLEQLDPFAVVRQFQERD